jgi:hypothetical protein
MVVYFWIVIYAINLLFHLDFGIFSRNVRVGRKVSLLNKFYFLFDVRKVLCNAWSFIGPKARFIGRFTNTSIWIIMFFVYVTMWISVKRKKGNKKGQPEIVS